MLNISYGKLVFDRDTSICLYLIYLDVAKVSIYRDLRNSYSHKNGTKEFIYIIYPFFLIKRDIFAKLSEVRCFKHCNNNFLLFFILF